jgi:hypothetical protein
VRIEIQGVSSGTSVLLDDRVLTPSQLARPILLNPGKHVVEVRRAGRRHYRTELRLQERETRVVRFAMNPLPERTRASSIEYSAARYGDFVNEPWFWVTAGALTVLGVAATAYAMTSDDFAGNVPPGVVEVR